MNLALQSMAIELPQMAAHPNRAGFRGVLTIVDAPSDKPPAGARGHRVVLTRAAAERALPSLLGMGIDYVPSLDGHNARSKVGIITEANIASSGLVGERRALEVAGYLYARDFPDVVQQIRRGGQRTLGMSYEIANALVAEVDAPIWKVTEFTFTGAALLRRDKAAYRDTWIELKSFPPPQTSRQFDRRLKVRG